MNLEIAKVKLSVRYPDSVILRGMPDIYQPFLIDNSTDNESIKTDIRLELENIPDTREMTKLFETGQSWSMFKKDDEYYLVLNPASLDKKVVWLAHFNDELKKITIYCSDLLINEDSDRTLVSNPVSYPLDQLLLMYILAQKGGILMHAAGIDVNGRGYIFPGRSGAGKSTLSRQFLTRKDNIILNDDRIIIRQINDVYKVFGTPWPGELGIAENKSTLLHGIFFIHHGNENTVKKLAPWEAMERLMSVTSIPWYDEKIMTNILQFCEDMVSDVPAFELHFRPDDKVAVFFEKFVSSL